MILIIPSYEPKQQPNKPQEKDLTNERQGEKGCVCVWSGVNST